VQLTDPRTVQPYEVRLSRDGVAQALRMMLYDPSSAAELPLKVHLAAQGDWKPLAETASQKALLADWTFGYYLGITCSEDVPFIRDEEIPAAVAGTFLGDFRIRKQRKACAGWPVAKIPASFLEPVVSDVPALIFSGERDPATPPAYGAEAARNFRHGKYVLVPDAGHNRNGFKGQECIDALWMKTVEDGSVDRLDTSCVAKMERPPFVLSLGDPEVAVRRADLEALVGSSVSEDGETVKISLQEGRLRLEIGPEVALLVPTAANRFRPKGFPPGYAIQFERDGEGPAAILMKPGQPGWRFTRKR
jgi:hypothetical protein